MMQTRIATSVAFISGISLMFAGTDVSFFDILFICIGVYTVFRILLLRDISWIWLKLHNKILLVFVAVLVIQMLYIPSLSYVSALTTLYLIGVYFLVYYWNSRKINVKKYITIGYAAGALISSLLGMLVYFIQLSMPTYDHLPFFWNHDVRMTVFFDDPVVYGAFLVPAFLILFYKFLYTEEVRSKIWIFLGLLMVYLNIILSGSRGAWLNAAITVAIFIILDRNLRNKSKCIPILLIGFIFSVMFYVVVFLVPLQGQTYYDATLKSRNLDSDSLRLKSWQNAPGLIQNRPVVHGILGSGGGMYERSSEQKLSAHNVYINTLYEYGVAGLLLFVSFYTVIITRLLKYIRISENKAYSIVCLGLIVGVLVQGFFVDTLHWRHIWMIVALL